MKRKKKAGVLLLERALNRVRCGAEKDVRDFFSRTNEVEDDSRVFFLGNDVNGVTLLHAACARGNVGILEAVLDVLQPSTPMRECETRRYAKAAYDACVVKKDKESGFNALHRAFFFGHLVCAQTLMRFLERRVNARSVVQELLKAKDYRDETPTQKIPIPPVTNGDGNSRSRGEIFSWGSNANCCFGRSLGTTGKSNVSCFQFFAMRYKSVINMSCSKFRSLAVTFSGKSLFLGS